MTYRELTDAVTYNELLYGLAAVAVLAAVFVMGRKAIRALPGFAPNRRGAALAGPAAQLGLNAVADDPLTDLPPFELLNTGTDRRPTNVLRGTVGGAAVVVFDYQFVDPPRKPPVFGGLHDADGPGRATICCVKGAWLSLPAFVMEPSLLPMFRKMESSVEQQLGEGRMASGVKALMHRAEGMIVEAPGFDFPDRPDVAYRVRGRDESAVRALLTQPVLDYFRDRPGWIVEGQGDWVLVTFPARLDGLGGLGPAPSVRASSPGDGLLAADRLDSLVTAATATLDVFRTAAPR